MLSSPIFSGPVGQVRGILEHCDLFVVNSHFMSGSRNRKRQTAAARSARKRRRSSSGTRRIDMVLPPAITMEPAAEKRRSNQPQSIYSEIVGPHLFRVSPDTQTSAKHFPGHARPHKGPHRPRPNPRFLPPFWFFFYFSLWSHFLLAASRSNHKQSASRSLGKITRSFNIGGPPS